MFGVRRNPLLAFGQGGYTTLGPPRADDPPSPDRSAELARRGADQLSTPLPFGVSRSLTRGGGVVLGVDVGERAGRAQQHMDDLEDQIERTRKIEQVRREGQGGWAGGRGGG